MLLYDGLFGRMNQIFFLLGIRMIVNLLNMCYCGDIKIISVCIVNKKGILLCKILFIGNIEFCDNK